VGTHPGVSKEAVTQVLYREHTPIEEYVLAGRIVRVKRDDMFSLPPAPALAKLRGIRSILQTLATRGIQTVGCFQTRVSNIGHALAAACQEFSGLTCVVVYPQSKNHPLPASVDRARELGARVCPIRSNVLPICYAQAKRLLSEENGVLLPFGMECKEAVEAVAVEASLLPASACRNATVIVPCGSGVTLAGILRGLPARPKRVVGVSSGRSVPKIRACVRRYIEAIDEVDFVEPAMSYYESPSVSCPFPAHPHYDLKAWAYLSEHIGLFPDPVLFWNVGG
jgi:1-aminocyclopropane-1-carboxylate deaminase/D-cysteine desulfhydrase-like pyridoxal-dependent ACC family enzyme